MEGPKPAPEHGVTGDPKLRAGLTGASTAKGDELSQDKALNSILLSVSLRHSSCTT